MLLLLGLGHLRLPVVPARKPLEGTVGRLGTLHVFEKRARDDFRLFAHGGGPGVKAIGAQIELAQGDERLPCPVEGAGLSRFGCRDDRVRRSRAALSTP